MIPWEVIRNILILVLGFIVLAGLAYLIIAVYLQFFDPEPSELEKHASSAKRARLSVKHLNERKRK